MKDLTGIKVGKLTVIKIGPKYGDGHYTWECKCDCGKITYVQSNNLQKKSPTRSCGCLRYRPIKKQAPNSGQSYLIKNGEHLYKNRKGWADAAIKLYGNKCNRCGWSEARCDVHHKVPKSEGGLNNLSNAEVICPNCHRKHHSK